MERFTSANCALPLHTCTLQDAPTSQSGGIASTSAAANEVTVMLSTPGAFPAPGAYTGGGVGFSGLSTGPFTASTSTSTASAAAATTAGGESSTAAAAVRWKSTGRVDWVLTL